MSDTQKQQILDYMVQFGSITTMEAFVDLGITKLTTRISELRRDGYDILGERIPARNRLGRKTFYNRYTINK